jgi:hypothetical protein
VIPDASAGAARADGARAAAQRAFFDAAFGKAATPNPAAAQPQPPAVHVTHVHRIPDPAAEPPQKILRPGSLLDIRV